MRDPERIDRILKLIRIYWKRYPDFRLAQIIGNAAASKNMGTDPYHYEDHYLEDELKKEIEKLGNGAIGSAADFESEG